MEFLQSIWESYEAFRDSVVTERVARGLYQAEFWVWIVAAAGLGALTLWTYWRCFVEVRRRELEEEARDAALRAMAPDLDAEEVEPGGEAHALRFRNWALETRLLRALEAARAGSPLSAEALADGLDEFLESGGAAGDDGVPAEAISALKYRNWRLEMRLAQLEDAGAAEADAEAIFAEPDEEALETIAALQRRGDRLEGWLRRLLDAARKGQSSVFAEVEAEMRGESEGALSLEDPANANLIRRIEELESEKETLEEEAGGLRYRRWLLARRLGDAVAAARAGAPLAVESLLADLRKDGEEPRYGADGPNPFFGQSANQSSAPASPADMDGSAKRAEELETLRRRLAAQQAEFAKLKAQGSAQNAAADQDGEAASLRYRLWLSQAELRRERARTAPPPAPVAEASPELRRKLASAEADLARLRSAPPQPAAPAKGPAMAARARLALQTSRLWNAERRLSRAGASDDRNAAMRAELSLLRERTKTLEAERAAAPSADALRKREEEAEAMKARLALAQAEAEKLRGELEAAQRRPKTLESGPALAAIRAAQASESGERFGLGSGAAGLGASPLQRPAQDRARPAQSAQAPASAPAPALGLRAEDGAELDESHLAARAALSEAIASPRRGVEDAARELIESGRVVAVGSNRPNNLGDAPVQAPTDDLTLIAGVTQKLETQMNRLGLHFFRQIAEFAPFDLAWLDDRLGLRGAVVRERWLPQADLLAQWRREGRLGLNDAGKYGRVSAKAATGRSAASDAAEETIDSLPPHPDAILVEGPLSGMESAALELLAAPGEAKEDSEAPASFSRQPFADDDDLDDLTAIRGVGPKLEAALRMLGVGRYRQLAVLSPGEAAWLDRRLGLGGRVLRDRWLPQAKALAERSEARRRAADEGAPPAAARPAVRSQTIPLRPSVTPAAPSQKAPSPAQPKAEAQLGLSAAERGALQLIETGASGRQPRPSALLPAPTSAAPDPLQRIEGVNAILEQLLNDIGVYYFNQLAGFSAADLAWLDAKLSFRGRVVRERWASQAAVLKQG